jgi:hypothetical protein
VFRPADHSRHAFDRRRERIEAMTRSAAYQWGRCPCGGTYEERVVEINMKVEGQVVQLTDVLQGACPNCGSRVYKAEMLGRIEAAMKNEPLDRRLNRAAL